MSEGLIGGKQNAFNATGTGVMMSRETLGTVERVLGAEIEEMLKSLNNDFKDVNHVEIVFSNTTGVQHNPTGPFRVVAIFGPLMGMGTAPFVRMVHEATPWATLRVLQLFEGKFSNFIEYPPSVEESVS
jgi:hypothetical protein